MLGNGLGAALREFFFYRLQEFIEGEIELFNRNTRQQGKIFFIHKTILS